ncbi:hypothetical protein SFIMM107S_05917 [Streptomyces griseus]
MYFAALLARTEDGWEASDTELDDVETLSDLTDLAREASVDEDTVLVYIEQEDAWFGVVRVDGARRTPESYVSDASAAARSSYGEILLTDEMLGREPGAEDEIAALEELVDLDGTEDGEPERPTPAAADQDDDAPTRTPFRRGRSVSSGSSPTSGCPRRSCSPCRPTHSRRSRRPWERRRSWSRSARPDHYGRLSLLPSPSICPVR